MLGSYVMNTFSPSPHSVNLMDDDNLEYMENTEDHLYPLLRRRNSEELKPIVRIPSVVKPLKWYANPRFAVCCGVIEIIAICFFLKYVNIIEGSFFRFGPPIQLFQYTITGTWEYVGVLVIFFLHQMIFTWLNEVLHPWLLNEVQDPKCEHITFSKPTTMAILNFYYLYYTVNNFIVINVSLSQISFLLTTLVADMIIMTWINLHYIQSKKYSPNYASEVELV